jgi:hypothetical protein
MPLPKAKIFLEALLAAFRTIGLNGLAQNRRACIYAITQPLTNLRTKLQLGFGLNGARQSLLAEFLAMLIQYKR